MDEMRSGLLRHRRGVSCVRCGLAAVVTGLHIEIERLGSQRLAPKDQIRGFFRDHHYRSVKVAVGDVREDRGIDHAQAV